MKLNKECQKQESVFGQKEKMERDDLTAKQLGPDGKTQYSLFLPALSGFYATYVGKQRHDPNYVDPARIPADFETGIEGLNWLNKEEAYFPYKWACIQQDMPS